MGRTLDEVRQALSEHSEQSAVNRAMDSGLGVDEIEFRLKDTLDDMRKPA